jgi:hypothetical protein
MFHQLNHIVGQARCHDSLACIQKNLGNHDKAREHSKESCELNSQFTKYLSKYKKSCPHV